ncbi:MAG: Fe-S cluster assembly protein SufD [Gloeomargarita sp. DG02_3_bins_56]
MVTDWLQGRPTLGTPAFLAWRDRALIALDDPNWPALDVEAWRGTEVKSLLTTPFHLPSGGERLETQLPPVPELPCSVTVVNGRVVDHGELPAGVSLGDWPDLSPAEQAALGRGLPADGFTALNQAAVAQVVLLRVSDTPAQPVHLRHQLQADSTPLLVCPRLVVRLAPAARLTLVTEYLSVGTGWLNGVVEIHLGQGSHLEHYLLQQESFQSAHLLRLVVHQAQDSHYTLRTVSAGARWSRCEPVIEQMGPGTVTELRGLTLVGNRQHSDMHSVINHHHPHGYSRQVQKCVAAGQGQAVFHGRVRVAAAAQWTDAGQLNQNLLLSKQAKVDTRPQLEIQADQVKCTHGATVSDLDPDALFYLQSRGIDAVAARSLLVAGFAQELLQEWPFPTLRQRCHLWMQKLTLSAEVNP